MNGRLKKQWVEALRSGNYKQSRGALCEVGVGGREYFCCLGVLYDIAAVGDWEKDAPETSAWGIPFDPDKDAPEDIEWGYLPSWVLRKVGLNQDQQQGLAILNDDIDSTFSTIADYIEARIPEGR